MRRDLHFQTRTTIDTLDYSGSGLNEGSKLVIAAAGDRGARSAPALPADLRLPDGFRAPRVCLPGVLAITARPFQTAGGDEVGRACRDFARQPTFDAFPLVVLVDDSEFCARSLNNFLWVTFTRSNPAADVRGGGERVVDKHWGCQGPLVIDARIKPHHAPPLEEDPQVSARVDRLFAASGPLAGLERA